MFFRYNEKAMISFSGKLTSPSSIETTSVSITSRLLMNRTEVLCGLQRTRLLYTDNAYKLKLFDVTYSNVHMPFSGYKAEHEQTLLVCSSSNLLFSFIFPVGTHAVVQRTGSHPDKNDNGKLTKLQFLLIRLRFSNYI
jgi:hypothetical protein